MTAPDDAPALAAADPVAGLPRPLTTFVGRALELVAVRKALAAHALVTLTGPGGGGKTRLALRAAGAILDAFPDGAWFVDLAPLSDASHLPQAALTALGVREVPGQPHLATLSVHLRSRRLLLLLDNCEHVVGASAALAAALLRDCPGVRILATSREPLGVPGEAVYPVPPLVAPDPGAAPSPERVVGSDAGRLFVERARLAQPDFAVTERNAAAVTTLCRRLDGLPLAIELAAARVRLLSPAQIVALLDDRFRVLGTGSRMAPPRQQTLAATLDWSHDLLSDAERTLLRRLAVFAGGWTLAAAEAVCACACVASAKRHAETAPNGAPRPGRRPPGSPGLRPGDVLDLLGHLVDKSLVVAEAGPDGEMRYRLLETVRQYARERLGGSGEARDVQLRYRDWYVALAERAAPELAGRQQALWFDRLAGEYDNLRAVLERGQSDTTPAGTDLQLRLTAALGSYWAVRGFGSEGRAWLAGALARPGAAARAPATRVLALAAAGRLEGRIANARRARALLEEGIALARATGDRPLLGRALEPLLPVLWYFDEPELREERFVEALDVARATRNARLLTNAHVHLGWAAFERGERESGRRWLEESQGIARAAGDESIRAYVANFQGRIAAAGGDGGAARAHYDDAMAVARAFGDRHVLAMVLLSLGDLERAQGAAAEALGHYQESLAAARETGYVRLIAESLLACASACAALGRFRGAALLAGAGATWAAGLDEPRPWCTGPSWAARYGDALGVARAALGEAAFDRDKQEGAALSPEAGIAAALEGGSGAAAPAHDFPTPAPAAVRTAPHPPLGLSRREAEVLELVAAGRSNGEIAAQLFLSVRTVERHLSRVYDRLGLRGKSARAAAAYAVGRGLATPAAVAD